MLQKVITNDMSHWLARRYGSRRGFVLTWWYRILYWLGNYRDYRRVKWQSVERLVFVCKGNICRSAYAEAVAQSLGVASISCGIDTTEGAPADEYAVRAAADKGIDLSGHQTRPLHALMLKKTDLLIAMEPWQVDYLNKELGKAYGCTLLGLWGTSVHPYVHDPFGASADYFSCCFNYIEQSVYEITRKIR